jgi:uncharacterized protein with HEPN domain
VLKAISKDLRILEEIITHCRDIWAAFKRFGDDVGKFQTDVHYQNSCMMSLMHVGNLSKRLSRAFKNEFNGVRWHETADFRSQVINYGSGVDACNVWSIIREELPGIRRYCENSLDVLISRMDSHERQIYKATTMARENMGRDTLVICAEPGGVYFGKIIGMLWGQDMDVIAIQKIFSRHAVLHMVTNLPAKASICVGDVLTIAMGDDGKSDIKSVDLGLTELPGDGANVEAAPLGPGGIGA